MKKCILRVMKECTEENTLYIFYINLKALENKNEKVF